MHYIADLQYSGNTVSINRLPSTVSGDHARSWPAQLTLIVMTCDNERSTHLRHIYHMTLYHPKIQPHTTLEIPSSNNIGEML